MSGSFFFIGIFFAVVVFLFFPIYVKGDAHYDLMRKKCAIDVTLFKKIKIFGGYITTYKGGLAIHKNKRTAILLPFEELDNERKRFSFIKTFKFVSFHSIIECSAEYFFLFNFLQRTSTILKKFNQKLENTSMQLWLTQEKSLKITFNCVLWFNVFILLLDIIEYLRGKLKNKWQIKLKKSTI